jgi:hypothetical protein
MLLLLRLTSPSTPDRINSSSASPTFDADVLDGAELWVAGHYSTVKASPLVRVR